MKRLVVTAFTALPVFLTNAAGASNIYMLTSGVISNDTTIAAALTANGHTVTIGVDYGSFNGTINLSGFDTFYLQCNANWSTAAVMPQAGQQQLRDFVNGGGRLVTSEWVIYYTYVGGKFEFLAPIIPAVSTTGYGSVATATYTQVTPDAVINAGLATSFEFPLNSFTGTETYTVAKTGAVTYYTTNNSPGAVGLCGWGSGEGSVFSFTSTCGVDQVLDGDFGRLFANVMRASAPLPPVACYANCDGSTASPVLTGNDFACFLNAYVAGQSYANCDGSAGTPTLTANDFICYISAYTAGCS